MALTLGTYARIVRERMAGLRSQVSDLREMALASASFCRDKDGKPLLLAMARRLEKLEEEMRRWPYGGGDGPEQGGRP